MFDALPVRAARCAPDVKGLQSMSCEKCKDLCVRFAIRQPNDLRRAIQIAKQNCDDGTISEVPESDPISQITFAALAEGVQWDDIVGHRFRCSAWRVVLTSCRDDYGSGGYWEPEQKVGS